MFKYNIVQHTFIINIHFDDFLFSNKSNKYTPLPYENHLIEMDKIKMRL